MANQIRSGRRLDQQALEAQQDNPKKVPLTFACLGSLKLRAAQHLEDSGLTLSEGCAKMLTSYVEQKDNGCDLLAKESLTSQLNQQLHQAKGQARQLEKQLAELQKQVLESQQQQEKLTKQTQKFKEQLKQLQEHNLIIPAPTHLKQPFEHLLQKYQQAGLGVTPTSLLAGMLLKEITVPACSLFADFKTYRADLKQLSQH